MEVAPVSEPYVPIEDEIPDIDERPVKIMGIATICIIAVIFLVGVLKKSGELNTTRSSSVNQTYFDTKASQAKNTIDDQAIREQMDKQINDVREQIDEYGSYEAPAASNNVISNDPNWYLGFWKAEDGSELWIGEEDGGYECFYEYDNSRSGGRYIGEIKGYGISDNESARLNYGPGYFEKYSDADLLSAYESVWEGTTFLLVPSKQIIVAADWDSEPMFTKDPSPSEIFNQMKAECISQRRAEEKAKLQEREETKESMIQRCPWLVGKWRFPREYSDDDILEIKQDGTIVWNGETGVCYFGGFTIRFSGDDVVCCDISEEDKCLTDESGPAYKIDQYICLSVVKSLDENVLPIYDTLIIQDVFQYSLSIITGSSGGVVDGQ